MSSPQLNRIVAAARRGDPEPDVRVLRGWRRELAGAELQALLAGDRTVGVDGRGLIAIGVNTPEPG